MQRALLNAFYEARRDTENDSRIKSEAIFYSAQLLPYETDFAVLVIKQLDDYFLELRAEKIRQEIKEAKNK